MHNKIFTITLLRCLSPVRDVHKFNSQTITTKNALYFAVMAKTLLMPYYVML